VAVRLPAGIRAEDVRFVFARSSGPGGQNVNKVSTAVQLRFDLRGTRSLEPRVKERLVRLAAGRMTDEGELVIHASRFRTQERNRQDALERLSRLIDAARTPPVVRRPTKPPATSTRRRLDAKRRQSIKKRLRARPAPEA
jgi:ribosome-associated protein